MRILDRALSRVRQGVKDTAAASADTALGQALSWLGSELRGDAVPERLRDAAGRLASFLGSGTDPRVSTRDPEADGVAHSAQGAPPVVSLEDALAARGLSRAVVSASDARPSLPVDSAHARDLAAGVCPFTGLRADGTVAAPPVAEAVAPPALAAAAPAHEEGQEPAAEVPAPRASKGAVPRTRAANPRQKSKERLAGAQTVENTSARSATRPARKQSRSRVQPSRKKA